MRNLSARLIDRRAFVAGALALASGNSIAGPLDPLGGGYMLFDNFTQTPQGPFSGQWPLIGPQWVEKDFATSASATDPGYSVITQDGLTSTSLATAAYNVVQLSETPGEVGFSFTLADKMKKYTPTVGVWNGGHVASNTGCLHVTTGNFTDNLNVLSVGTAEYVPGVGVIGATAGDGVSDTPPFSPGSVYAYRCLIDGDWSLSLVYNAAGQVLAQRANLCAGISGRLGPWLYLETFAGVTYKTVWARRPGTTTLNLAL